MLNFKPQKLFFVVNVDWFFLSHRLSIALAAQKNGYEVTIITGNSGRINEIGQVGLQYIEMPVSRAGTNIFKELYALWFLVKLYVVERPDLVHHVSPKMVAYGSLAARLTGTKALNAVSGLGTLFSEENSHNIFRKIILFLFKLGLGDENQKVIFQNKDDEHLFVNKNIIKPHQAILIMGSGVDLQKFSYSERKSNQNEIIITLPARMLYDKGIVEFVEMAQLVKEQLPNIALKLQLAGGTDEGSAKGISQKQLKEWDSKGFVCWLGHQDNMADILVNTDIVVFTSYREGLPKSLIEACAIGRPIICFDVVGCREVVKNGINGYLIPFKNIDKLVESVINLVENKNLRTIMGINGREIAEEKFGLEKVIEKTLLAYKRLLSKEE